LPAGLAGGTDAVIDYDPHILFWLVLLILLLSVVWQKRRSHGYRPRTETPNRRPPQGGSGTAKPASIEDDPRKYVQPRTMYK